jgi:hypothetical protein
LLLYPPPPPPGPPPISQRWHTTDIVKMLFLPLSCPRL